MLAFVLASHVSMTGRHNVTRQGDIVFLANARTQKVALYHVAALLVEPLQ